MATLSFLEKKPLEAILGMEDGYVLDFTDKTYSDFFMEHWVIIYDKKYGYKGNSKANRMRAFWEQESDKNVGEVLKDLLLYWAYMYPAQKGNDLHQRCIEIINKLNKGGSNISEDEKKFLEKDFGEILFHKLPIKPEMVQLMQSRHKEALLCLKHDLFLSAVILCGSILEGILLGVALQNSALFTEFESASKFKGKVKKIEEWNLSSLIDVACSVNLLGKDVKYFSHGIREFRNYIHPYKQIVSPFNPSLHTSKICMQVLYAAIADLSEKR